jgi:hypothetical protein
VADLVEAVVDHPVVEELDQGAAVVADRALRPPRELGVDRDRGAGELRIGEGGEQGLLVLRQVSSIRSRGAGGPSRSEKRSRIAASTRPGSKSPTAITAMRSGRYQSR